MRSIGLATIAIQIGLIIPAHAENTGDPDRSITDVLPLFVKNRCEDIRNPADQMIDSSAAFLFEVPGSNSPPVVQELQIGGT